MEREMFLEVVQFQWTVFLTLDCSRENLWSWLIVLRFANNFSLSPRPLFSRSSAFLFASYCCYSSSFDWSSLAGLFDPCFLSYYLTQFFLIWSSMMSSIRSNVLRLGMLISVESSFLKSALFVFWFGSATDIVGPLRIGWMNPLLCPACLWFGWAVEPICWWYHDRFRHLYGYS